MDSLISDGRALPFYAALPATTVALVMLIMTLRHTHGRATRFIVFAIWLRFILSAFHPVTFAPSPLGPSWNALASLCVCGLGMTVLRRRSPLDAGFIPFYFMFAAIIASGLANSRPGDTFDMLIKYIYLAVILMTVAEAFEENDWEYTLKRLFVPFIVPFGFQALSVLLGVSKVTELDNSVSYIGGFKHEAGFSVSLAGGFLVICLRRNLGAAAKTALVTLCFAGIVLANYRTAILALAPMLGAVALIGATRRVLPQQRVLVVGIIGVLVLAVAGIGAITSADRFADVATVITRNTDLIQRVEQYPEADRRIMSGRPLIWSEYIYGYIDGSDLQHLFGRGPSEWEEHFKVYAHNTLLSALYELGVFGVFAMCFLWAWMLALAWRVRSPARVMLVTAHLSFFILNMATMPLWMIEGILFYGILCGATVFCWRDARARHVAPRAGAGMAFQPRVRSSAA